MLDTLKKVKPENFRDKVDKLLANSVIAIKYQSGLSVKRQKPINKLFQVQLLKERL